MKVKELKGTEFDFVTKNSLKRNGYLDELSKIVNIEDLKNEILENKKYNGKVYGLIKKFEDGTKKLIMCGIVKNETFFKNDELLKKSQKLRYIFSTPSSVYSLEKIYATEEYSSDVFKEYFLSHLDSFATESISLGDAKEYKIGDISYKGKNYSKFGFSISGASIAMIGALIIGILTHSFLYGFLFWLFASYFLNMTIFKKSKEIKNKSSIFESTDQKLKVLKDDTDTNQFNESILKLFITKPTTNE